MLSAVHIEMGEREPLDGGDDVFSVLLILEMIVIIRVPLGHR